MVGTVVVLIDQVVLVPRGFRVSRPEVLERIAEFVELIQNGPSSEDGVPEAIEPLMVIPLCNPDVEAKYILHEGFLRYEALKRARMPNGERINKIRVTVSESAFPPAGNINSREAIIQYLRTAMDLHGMPQRLPASKMERRNAARRLFELGVPLKELYKYAPKSTISRWLADLNNPKVLALQEKKKQALDLLRYGKDGKKVSLREAEKAFLIPKSTLAKWLIDEKNSSAGGYASVQPSHLSHLEQRDTSGKGEHEMLAAAVEAAMGKRLIKALTGLRFAAEVLRSFPHCPGELEAICLNTFIPLLCAKSEKVDGIVKAGDYTAHLASIESDMDFLKEKLNASNTRVLRLRDIIKKQAGTIKSLKLRCSSECEFSRQQREKIHLDFVRAMVEDLQSIAAMFLENPDSDNLRTIIGNLTLRIVSGFESADRHGYAATKSAPIFHAFTRAVVNIRHVLPAPTLDRIEALLMIRSSRLMSHGEQG